MPESAEVAIFADQAQANYGGKEIEAINLVGGRFLKEDHTYLSRLEYPMRDLTFKSRGKFLYAKTSIPDQNLCWTLGMTGSFSPDKSKHSAVEFKFKNDNLYFNDIRHFGTFTVRNKDELDKKLKSLKWDILKEDPLASIMDDFERYKNKSICSLLLNQEIFSGCGNYIRAEALYDARIHPLRFVNNLSMEEKLQILTSIKKIAKEAYSVGGATLHTFKDLNGNSGGFFKSFKVYGKKQDPNGYNVLREVAPDGRSIFYCPDIQK